MKSLFDDLGLSVGIK
jgi:hypothetical protein